ncbi:hypothetical protein FN846DRAFT_888041 [Sphaerosporella brunnea]|uniref:Uncharacterized protein n=1 Tax=Sphaerosporella brunnea TaxID=1250544 RepID=A0A5J5F3U6_9PEZI|nr:hypothetical protein FN846DRAFT_888041 [Sphaerosporella brunnea]
MKIASATIVLLTSLVGLTAAWDIEVAYSDNTRLKFHGHTNSHCTKFKKTDADITSVYFKGSTFADTWELFADDKCKHLVAKGKHGLSSVPVRKYGSYKVF